MDLYKNEEFLYRFFKFALLLNNDLYFKPKKEDDIKKALGLVSNIKEAARKLKNNNMYFEIILMSDEIEELLKEDLKQK